MQFNVNINNFSQLPEEVNVKILSKMDSQTLSIFSQSSVYYNKISSLVANAISSANKSPEKINDIADEAFAKGFRCAASGFKNFKDYLIVTLTLLNLGARIDLAPLLKARSSNNIITKLLNNNSFRDTIDLSCLKLAKEENYPEKTLSAIVDKIKDGTVQKEMAFKIFNNLYLSNELKLKIINKLEKKVNIEDINTKIKPESEAILIALLDKIDLNNTDFDLKSRKLLIDKTWDQVQQKITSGKVLNKVFEICVAAAKAQAPAKG